MGVTLTLERTQPAGEYLGDVVGATDVTLNLPHMRVSTASFTVPMNHDAVDYIFDNESILKIYRGRQLLFRGHVTSIEEAADPNEQTATITASGPLWLLSRRIVPSSRLQGGLIYGSGLIPSGHMGGIQYVQDMLKEVNDSARGNTVGRPDTFGSTGITLGTRPPLTRAGIGSVSRYGPVWSKTAADVLTELATGGAGKAFEFEFQALDNKATDQTAPWANIAQMNLDYKIGLDRPDVVFEYGTTKANVESYSRSQSRDSLITRGFIGTQEWPTSGSLMRNEIYLPFNRMLYEEVIPDQGLTDDFSRQTLLDLHMAIRQNPRLLIQFTPAMNASPQAQKDYFVGDTISFIAKAGKKLREYASVRVWGVALNYDVNGNERTSLELVMP